MDYECRGGPLCGSRREMAAQSSRLYVCRRQTAGEDPLRAALEEAESTPTGLAWVVEGYYERRVHQHRRHGSRTVLAWRALTGWPIWLNEEPWRPSPPPPFQPPPPPEFQGEDGG